MAGGALQECRVFCLQNCTLLNLNSLTLPRVTYIMQTDIKLKPEPVHKARDQSHVIAIGITIIMTKIKSHPVFLYNYFTRKLCTPIELKLTRFVCGYYT